MKRKRLLLVLVAVVVALNVIILGVWWFGKEREPSYLDKPQSYWLEEFHRADRTGAASDAFRSMGPATLPYVMRCFEHTQDLASAACLALKALGSNAAPAIPQLKETLEKNDWRGEMALLCIGSAASNALVESCSFTNEAVRVRAALTLARVAGRRPRDAVGFAYMTSPQTGKPIVALAHHIDGDDIANLTSQLAHREAAVRQASAEALKKCGSQARAARRALTALLTDPEPEIAQAAREALDAIESRKQ
jgi:HEAT repeat protein